MTRSRCIDPGATPNSSMSQLRLRRPSSKSTSSVRHSTPTFRRRGRCPGPTASATCAPWTAGGQRSACATPLTMTPPRQRVLIAWISLDEGRRWLVREGQAQLEGAPATLLSIHQGHVASVAAGRFAAEVETEPDPGDVGVGGGQHTAEAREQLLAIIGGDAEAVVGDADARPAVGGVHRAPHLAPAR